MRTVTIKVTPRDIQRGKCGDVAKCPIALAVKRTRRGWRHVEVTGDDITYFDHGRQMRADLPDIAEDFVLDFDRITEGAYDRTDFPAFEFELNHSVRLTGLL